MPQQKVWENEYRNPKLVTKHDKPQADVLRFLKWLKKNQKVDVSKLKVLDLGSGTGRNANYLAQKGAKVTGIEIAKIALDLAKDRSKNSSNPPKYLRQSIGEHWPLKNGSVNLVLDVLSSNSLSENERTVYLSELKRVLAPSGYIFIKTLAKEGDKNAQTLLMLHPGREKDTYIMPELGLTERVFDRKDFLDLYRGFEVLGFESKKSRIPFAGTIYVRKFILAYLKKAS